MCRSLSRTNIVDTYFRDMRIFTRSKFKSPRRPQAPFWEDRIVLPNRCLPNSLGLWQQQNNFWFMWSSFSLRTFSDIFSLWTLKAVTSHYLHFMDEKTEAQKVTELASDGVPSFTITLPVLPLATSSRDVIHKYLPSTLECISISDVHCLLRKCIAHI